MIAHHAILPLSRGASSRFTLRGYQEEAVAAGVSFFQDGKDDNGVMVEPTGCGKSIIIANIAHALGEPMVVFQPSREILWQNLEKFQAYGIEPGVFSATAGRKELGEVTLATIGSVVEKPGLFAGVKHCIIDECHLVNSKDSGTMFQRFLSGLPGVRVLGLTATPYRLTTDGYGGSILKFLTRTRPRTFSRVVHVTQNGDLFRAGYLAKLDYKQVKTGFDKTKLRLNTTGADFTDESVRTHYKDLHFSDQIVRCVERLHQLGRRGTLVFTRFVEEAEYVARCVKGAAVVSARTPDKERKRLVDGFRSGEIPALVNVGVFVVGFDYPALANVVLAQPTLSLARYYQMVGRVVRPHPDKAEAFVVDMCGLVAQFGRVEDLVVERGPHDKWFVSSRGKQLTNVYYGEVYHGRKPEKRLL